MNAAERKESPLRVVIIDDTEDLRELLRFALARGGMDVVAEAGDGRAGIEAVRDSMPDVVLLDLSMPVMDGMAALPHLRELAPYAKIIVLSGFGANQMAERALAIGADGYLQKGMPLARILERVRDIALGSTSDPVRPSSLHVVDSSERAPTPAPDADPATEHPTAWDALELAPYGVLELTSDPPFRLLHANPAAARLLGQEPTNGVALEVLSAEIAVQVLTHRSTGRTSYSLTLGSQHVGLTVREASQSLLVYLEDSSKELHDLRRTVATTAHDIRGPVAVLSALAETISQQDVSDPDHRAQLLSSVARQARVIDGITGDLLVTAEVERGTLRLHAEPVNLTDAIESVLAAHQAPIMLEVEDPRSALVDPLRFEQMLGNLLRNATKYGRPPMVVTVRPHGEDDGLLQVEVRDSGDGMPEEFREQLFAEFSRAPGTTVGGIGLGLHVVRILAEAHGGSVSYAAAPGGGSVFTLKLPTA